MTLCFALTGPTGSGKTALSLPLAEKFGCEIVSCDSMQIYRGMDIGTAKATVAERARVPHHLLDICAPDENYSASDYARDAARVCAEIVGRGKTPLFVGGTGLYLDTFTRGEMLATPKASAAYRASLAAQAESEEGQIALWESLRQIDPISAAATHYHNVRRVIRALEIYEATGKPKSVWDEESRAVQKDVALCHITLDFHRRETLYRRTDRRVDEMFAAGLEEEARGLLEKGLLTPESTAAQAIGYKELQEYLAGKLSRAEAVGAVRLSTRHYAKRQLTWFRHTDAARVFVDTEEGEEKPFPVLLAEAESIFASYRKESL